MFADFNGLPLHALVLHAAVVFAPLAALAGLAMLVPRWRRAVRWPFLVLSAIAVGSVYVARESGEALQIALGPQVAASPVGALIQTHQDWALRLQIAVLVLFVAAAIAVLLVPRVQAGWVMPAVLAVVVVSAVTTAWFTYETGEAGAKAVWNPTGSVYYSGG